MWAGDWSLKRPVRRGGVSEEQCGQREGERWVVERGEHASSFVAARLRRDAATSGSTCGSRLRLAQQVERDRAVRVDEHAADFHADPLGADGGHVGGHRLDRARACLARS